MYLREAKDTKGKFTLTDRKQTNVVMSKKEKQTNRRTDTIQKTQQRQLKT